jgi:hypothetical protein
MPGGGAQQQARLWRHAQRFPERVRRQLAVQLEVRMRHRRHRQLPEQCLRVLPAFRPGGDEVAQHHLESIAATVERRHGPQIEQVEADPAAGGHRGRRREPGDAFAHGLGDPVEQTGAGLVKHGWNAPF